MLKAFAFCKAWGELIHNRTESFLSIISTYAFPIIIGCISVYALFNWPASAPPTNAQQTRFQVLVPGTGTGSLAPENALKLLKQSQSTVFIDTHLSEAPFWFAFLAPAIAPETTSIIELPSRHANELSCWDGTTFQLLGRADRATKSKNVSQVKAGYALTLTKAESEKQILCSATFIGPARLSLVQWNAEDIQINSQVFQRKAGLVEGGLIVLAMFVLITAFINRDVTYVLFATWLILNLRMAALSAGWDTEWLGFEVPQKFLFVARPITIAAYYVLTIIWFKTLFRDDLKEIGYPFLLNFAQSTCLPILCMSILLPYQLFLPLVWVVSAVNIVVLTFYLIRILIKRRSRVAMWYAASLGITLYASLYEVLSAALGVRGMIGSINSVTAALSSTLLAALAIAERMRLEHDQRLEAQAEVEHTYEAMPIGLFTLDTHGQFISANPALQAMLGTRLEPDNATFWIEYFGVEAWAQLHHQVTTQADGMIELKGKEDANGEARRYMVKATLARGKIEGSLQDVTEQSKATEDLHFMANNDPLTKVFNRRGIEKVFANAMLALAEGKPLTMAFLDLDRFKLINDLFGHSAGDEVLKQVCQRISSQLSGAQQMGRVGGDEFLILLPDTAVAEATAICRQVINCIGTLPYRVGDKAFQVRSSIGLIEVNPGTLIKNAVSAADRACREAKAGKNEGLVVYEKNASVFCEREAELDLVTRLSSSTATDSLFLDMQPIMSLSAPHESLNFEVLLRMRDLDGSVIPAGRIIGAAENSGLIGMIDRWVLSTTLNWLDANFDELPNTRFVCMNLSGASLNDERFVQDAYAMLANHSRVAQRLCMEITESVALHDLENTRRFIDKVRSYGVKVALDDFGAGYTSFSYLKELPADLLKIDGNFIVNMNAHPANIAIVEAIISLARNLGMKTIAEWAEDNATVQTLVEIGVDYVQGYAIARPQTPSAILAAKSGASFVKNPELARYLQLIGKADDTSLSLELVEQARYKKMH